MDLGDLNIKSLGKDLFESKGFSDFVSNFINELKDYLEKSENKSVTNMNRENKYGHYWDNQNFIEDNVAATIGLSRWSTNITYSDELSKNVDDSILEIAEKEGTIYRKQFSANGSLNGQVYNIDKFENGKITHINIPENSIPRTYQNEDIIFRYNENGEIKVRSDLKEEIINVASKKSQKLKQEENEKANDFKKEGHMYEAFEDDGYIFLNDLTEERNFSIEDIDFVVDNYEGDGKYQVINGEYEKVE